MTSGGGAPIIARAIYQPLATEILVADARRRRGWRLRFLLTWMVIVAGLLAFVFVTIKLDPVFINKWIPFILTGVPVTLFVSGAAILLAIVLAILGALGRLSANPLPNAVASFYVSFFRGTPLLLQILFIYLALPQAGIVIPELPTGILALGLNYGAYMTEIFRAGIQSVSHGQAEAADALGMTYRQKMRRVVLPQAFRVIIPPTGNEFIAMMKDTALISILGQGIEKMELFRRAQLLGNADVRPTEALVTAAALYWALTAVFTFFQARLERRVGKGYVRTVALGPKARERGKMIVTGTGGGGAHGAASGYAVDAPEEVLDVGGHAHGAALPSAPEDPS